jgi:hypothetical protein
MCKHQWLLATQSGSLVFGYMRLTCVVSHRPKVDIQYRGIVLVSANFNLLFFMLKW